MKRQFLSPIAIILGTILIMTSDVFQSKQSDTEIVYSITKTMSPAVTVTTSQDTSSTTDPYFSQQWALYNDGTFSTTGSNSDGETFGDGGLYDGGVFTNEPVTPPNRSTTPVPGRNRIPNSFPNNSFKKFSLETLTSIKAMATTAVAGVDIAATKAWELLETKETGQEVIIAVIDTGVDYTHEDLVDAIWTNDDEIPGDGIDNDNNGYIDDYYGWDFFNNTAFVYNSKRASEYDHGTHCAGTIAAAINSTGIAGIASNSNVSIMIVQALGGKDGSGETSSIIKAIEYAEDMGATICNLSFGTSSYDAELEAAIEASDMLFVCAAGNGDNSGKGVNTDTTPLYPASFDFDNIISVANLSYDGTLDSSSNYGTKSVDIAAPGTYILSTTTGNDYEYLSGSSMSAPMVTAITAMAFSYYEDITVQEAKEIVLFSAEPLNTLTDKVATNGMVNAYNVLTADLDEILK